MGLQPVTVPPSGTLGPCCLLPTPGALVVRRHRQPCPGLAGRVTVCGIPVARGGCWLGSHVLRHSCRALHDLVPLVFYPLVARKDYPRYKRMVALFGFMGALFSGSVYEGERVHVPTRVWLFGLGAGTTFEQERVAN